MQTDIKIKNPGPGAEEIAAKIKLEIETAGCADTSVQGIFAGEGRAAAEGAAGIAEERGTNNAGGSGGISGFAFKRREFIKRIPIFGKIARYVYRLKKDISADVKPLKFIALIVYKIPVVNYFAKTAVFLATIPKKVKWMERLEADALAAKERLEAELGRKADAAVADRLFETLRTDISSVSSALTVKADAEPVRAELASLSSALSEKADAAVADRLFETLRTDISFVSSALTVKADAEPVRAELASLSSALSEKADKKIPEKLEPYYIEDACGYLEAAAGKFYSPVKEFGKFNREELYYSLFEQVFYDHNAVMEKQKVYLDYVPKINSAKLPHLDAGCGRGEFLSILKEKGFSAVGVDVNGIETAKLKKDGFAVTNSDLIEFLQETDASFSSVSALQVIEHLDYPELKRFLELSYEKLAKDGTIILETLNPLCLFTFSAFYMDDTHKRPLPPDYIIFLLQWTGFKNIKIVYSFPMPENKRFEDKARNYHDYAVIGRKL